MHTCVTALILAAGCGSRMKLDVTKQKIVIGAESVLHRSVRAFDECSLVNKIIVVSRADEIEFSRTELSDIKKLSAIVEGGETRAQSAAYGFKLVDSETDYVAIHDAARCFVKDEMITKVINDAILYGAATASCNVTDTVKIIDSNKKISATVDRNSLMLVQTPQVFRAELYKKALENVNIADSTLTDDNMLLERIGVKVHCTDTGRENIKLTTKEDLVYANFLLNGEIYV